MECWVLGCHYWAAICVGFVRISTHYLNILLHITKLLCLKVGKYSVAGQHMAFIDAYGFYGITSTFWWKFSIIK